MKMLARSLWASSVVVAIVLFATSVVSVRSHEANDVFVAANKTDKQGKVFSLFSVVQFKNTGCRSQSALASGQSAFRNGTCYTSSECSSKGGVASGNCAAGFGVCCIFLVSNSGSTVLQNCSYIRNPGFPSSYTGTNAVTFTVQKCTSEVCYLRLDFESFNLLGPSTTDEATNGGGSCARDAFKVTTATGQSTTSVPTICGLNTGQHIYVDMGNQNTDSVTLAFTFTTTTTTRNWEIKVSQIECWNPARPPNGCLQYWTTLTGRITTFNFLSTTSTHLASQDVTACIRRQDGYCCVQYQVCANVPNAFSLSVKSQAAADKGDIDTLCTLDYVTIPGSSISCSQNSNTVNSKYCSPWLDPSRTAAMINVPVCDCTAPFYIRFHTDNMADTVIASATITVSRGDCLDYTQIPCTS